MPNEPRLLLITSSFPADHKDVRAAAGVFVQDFSIELAKRANIKVVTQATKQQADGNEEPLGFPVCRFGWAGKGKPLSTLKLPEDIRLVVSVLFRGLSAVVRSQKDFSADRVLAFWAIPSGIWALAVKWLFGIPYTVWCLGSDVWDYMGHPVKRFFLKTILRNAEKRYADGFALVEDVRAVSGMDCDFLATSRNLPVSSAERVCLDPAKHHYLFIGRYHSNKGPDVLLQAVQKLSQQKREKLVVHVFGGGPLFQQLNDYVDEKGLSPCVSLHGFIEPERAAGYLKSVKALIIPSRIESIPVVLSDALQADTPIIATDVGDMGFLLKKYRAGVVVPPEAPEELARAIEHHMSVPDPFYRGRKALLDLFRIPNTVDRLLKTFEP